jgi:hypothetical protein
MPEIKKPSQHQEVAYKIKNLDDLGSVAIGLLDKIAIYNGYRGINDLGEVEVILDNFIDHDDKMDLTDLEIEQSLVLISYLEKVIADKQLSEIDKIWNEIFERQIVDLKRLIEEKADEQKIASLSLNILVANTLSVNHLSIVDKRTKYDQRMWSIAQSGLGKTILKSAKDNIGFCVLTQEYKPIDGLYAEYESVAEQIGRFDRLLDITDDSYMEDDNILPPLALSSGSVEQIQWYFELIISRGQFNLARESMRYVDPSMQKQMVYYLDKIGLPAGNFVISDYNSLPILPPEELIDLLIQQNKYNEIPTYINKVSPQNIEAIVSKIIDQHDIVLSIFKHIDYDDNFRRKLSFSFFKKMVELGFNPNLNLLSSDDLTEDALYWLIDKYISSLRLVLNIVKSTKKEMQMTIFNKLLSYRPPKTYDIFASIDCFDLLDKKFLIEEILERDPTFNIGISLGNLINEFDKNFIELLLNKPIDDINLNSIVYTVLNFEDCDTSWLLALLVKKDKNITIIKNIDIFKKYLNNDAIKEIISKAMVAEKNSIDIYVIRALIPELGAQWLLNLIFEHDYLSLIFEEFELFKDVITAQQIVDFSKKSPRNIKRVIDLGLMSDDMISVLKNEFKEKKEFSMFFAVFSIQDTKNLDNQEIIEFAFSDYYALQEFLKTDLSKNIIIDYGVHEFIIRMIDEDFYDLLYKIYEIAKDEDKKLIIVTLIQEKQRYTLMEIIRNHFNDLPFSIEELRSLLIENNLENVIFENFEILYEGKLEHSSFDWKSQYTFQEIIEMGMSPVIIYELSRIYGNKDCNGNKLTQEQLVIALEDTIDKGFINYVKFEIDSVNQILHNSTIDKKITKKIIENGLIKEVIKYQDLFGDPTIELVEIAFINDFGDAIVYYEFYKNKGNKPISWVEKGFTIFGYDCPLPTILAVKYIDGDMPLPEYLRELGITYNGDKGLDQLKQVVNKIKSTITDILIDGDDRDKIMLIRDNPIARAYAKRLIKFSDAIWGAKDDNAWFDMLSNTLNIETSKLELPPDFIASTEIAIPTKDAVGIESIKISQDVTQQFEKYKNDISYILNLIKEPDINTQQIACDLSLEIFTILKDHVIVLEGIINDIVNEKKEKQLIGLGIKLKKIQQFLKNIDLDDPISLLQNIHIIEGIKIKSDDFDLESLKRRLAISIGFNLGNPDLLHNAITYTVSKPDKEGIIIANDFISNHIVQTLLNQDNIPKESKKAIKTLLNTESFMAYIYKIKGIANSGFCSIRFVPNRGLMLELSGHYSDACWASRYKSITEEFDNITCISFLRNHGKSSERIVGSCLIIEAVDQQTADEVLIIRGFNPIENFVMDTDIDKFVSEFVDYIKSIAGNRKVAIVLDSASGGALTNRPELHKFLIKKYFDNSKQPLKLDTKKTTFNGYTLTLESGYPVYYI